MRPLALLVIVGLWVAGAAKAGETAVLLAGMKVTVWSEETSTPTKQPVIIFSHGFHGCATQSRFLMEAFASRGYLVFAPNHRDATCDSGNARLIAAPEVAFRRPELWNDTTYRDREEDIRRLIDAISSDDRFATRADLSRLGLSGHSLGGYTVLGLAGAWPSWKLGGVKAVLALSPYSQPFIVHDRLGGLDAPVMYQGGTRDLGITPSLRKNEGAYEQSPTPKYYVEFDKAGHFAWTNLSETAHGLIVAYSLAFMNHYVKGEAADPILAHTEPGVARLSSGP
ncbi:MAG TPA: dienelactone hydrolase family protein [Myxococcota bacterium]|nr:dienelactone hydrolase family protein [Myxococcota bacterium]